MFDYDILEIIQFSIVTLNNTVIYVHTYQSQVKMLLNLAEVLNNRLERVSSTVSFHFLHSSDLSLYLCLGSEELTLRCDIPLCVASRYLLKGHSSLSQLRHQMLLASPLIADVMGLNAAVCDFAGIHPVQCSTRGKTSARHSDTKGERERDRERENEREV